MRMHAFRSEMTSRISMYGFQWSSAGSSEKTPQIFGPPLPAEYVTVFSGQTDAPEVICDLTDRHTDKQTNYRNPPTHARRGLIISPL